MNFLFSNIYINIFIINLDTFKILKTDNNIYINGIYK